MFYAHWRDAKRVTRTESRRIVAIGDADDAGSEPRFATWYRAIAHVSAGFGSA